MAKIAFLMVAYGHESHSLLDAAFLRLCRKEASLILILKWQGCFVAYHSLSNEGGSSTDSTATEPCILNMSPFTTRALCARKKHPEQRSIKKVETQNSRQMLSP